MTAGALVVNADDLGVSKGATLGVVRAHREGIVTSASLAATTPFYGHALDACVRACPDLGIGLHFTLTSGRPVSPAGRVPLLVGPDGRFRWRFTTLFAALLSGAPRGLSEQITVELDAQLDRLAADGIRPDHIDGERHVHLIPGIIEPVLAAARRRGIPFVRMGREFARPPSAPAELLRLALAGGCAKSWLLSALAGRARRAAGDGVLSAERVASYLYTGRLDLLLGPLLASAVAPGVVEVMVHPGVPEESRGSAPGNPALENYLVCEDRRRELDACVAARASAGGWNLTTFGRIARERAERP